MIPSRDSYCSNMQNTLLQELILEDYWNCTAICYDNGERKLYVTYSDLLQSSSEFAGYLRKCVGVNKFIGLYAPPSVDLFIAILGILKVPAAYVPIALNQPDNSKMELLHHLQISIVVVHNRLLLEFLTLPWYSIAELNYESSRDELHIYSIIPHHGEAVSLREETQDSIQEELAYVMTTSGTTGVPKIVRVPHRCIVPNIIDLRRRFKLSSDDVIFNAAPYTFDPSVVEMFLAFSSGAVLLVAPEAVKVSPTQLGTILCHRNLPTVIQATPSLIYSLGSDIICSKLLGPHSSLQVLAFGGEACPSSTTLAQWQHSRNNTRIFNIYGITEVSSWATCYELPQAPDSHTEQPTDSLLSTDGGSDVLDNATIVPLGDSLLDTCVELRDEYDSVVTSGNGEIWIGGHSRVCFLDNEGRCTAGTMRPTGDYGGYRRSDGQLCYIGRMNKQIKRLGHRINLDHIQQVISDISVVRSCAIASHVSDLHIKLWGDNYITLALFVVPNSHNNSDDVLLCELHSEMRQLLPTYCIPDSIIVMDTLPMTDHGKVDTSLLLMKYARRNNTDIKYNNVIYNSFVNVNSVEMWISSLANIVGVDGWKPDMKFTQCGGDSFQLVQIVNLIDDNLGAKVSDGLGEFMELALNRSLHDAAVCLFEHLTISDHVTSRTNIDDETAILSMPIAKRQKLSTTVTSEAKRIELRKGHFYVNNQVMLPRLYSTVGVTTTAQFTLEVCWTVDTQKCVDASPLIVSHRNDSDDVSWLMYIGSHSGLFFAIDVFSGDIVWQALLTDRIMSSAALSSCGRYVIVGSYDGYLHVMDAMTGIIHWALNVSNEPIKSSPSVDGLTGFVWFGSHDHHLYSIDIEKKQIVHKLSINGGSIMSSPLIDVQRRQLYVSTLAGHVVAINCDSAELLWRHKFSKPVFPSPSLLHDHSIVVGCVSGELVKLAAADGIVVGELRSEEAIFESVCPYKLYTSLQDDTAASQDSNIVDTVNVEHWNGTLELCIIHDCNKCFQDFFLFGDHDNVLYSVTKEMCINWKVKLDSPIGSCPFTGSLNLPQGKLEICCCCTVNGNVFVLDVTTGEVLVTQKLPGEIFSSPLILANRIVVGCRDNNVYCLKLNII